MSATSPRLSPQERNIAQVFQFPVVYDTMTVDRTSLRPAAQTAAWRPNVIRRVGRIAEMLEPWLIWPPRWPRGRRRTEDSLGRGLVREDVAAVLFDEPRRWIDPHLKWQLRRKLKQIHHELKLADLRDARPGRGAHLRRPGGGDDPRPVVQLGTAMRCFERHTFVDPLHRLAGHEPLPCGPACPIPPTMPHCLARCRRHAAKKPSSAAAGRRLTLKRAAEYRRRRPQAAP